MNPDRSDRMGRTLLGGLVISIFVHFLVIGSLIGKWSGQDRTVVRMTNTEPVDQILNRPVLGIKRSKAVTLTWLGFETPTDHTAPKAPVEQAAMDTHPASDPAPAPLDSQKMAKQASELAAAAVKAVAAARSEVAGVIDAALKPLLARLAAMGRARPPSDAEPARAQADEAAEAVATNPGPGLAFPADKESIATAIKEASDYKPGKPVAAQGLDIKTVRPDWAHVTTLTAYPRNPIVWIAFGADGVVTRAGFVPGNSSGSLDVDEPLLNAVYAWKASGKELKKLGKDDEIIVSIRILLR